MSATWAKRHRAVDAEDAETWEATDIAPTLSEFDQRDVRAVVLVTADYFETRVARNLSAEAIGDGAPRQTGKGDAAPMVLISSSGDSPARTSAWPASGPDFPASAAVYGLSSLASLTSYGPAGASSRMFLGFSPRTKDATLPSSSTGWRSAGTASRGEYWMLDISESPSGAVECSLSAALETEPPPPQYWLSAKAAAGILRRATKRGKQLPPPLREALERLAQGVTPPAT